ncbi:hypothetical protein Trydic_g21596 [Trypoxylus dichotomus]
MYCAINEHLPYEQAAFRPNGSCREQVLTLTSYIESGFQISVAFVDLNAAYDTVRTDGLMLKLIEMIPCLKLLLVSLRFKVYISDMPNTVSRKFRYADYMAITTQNKHLDEVESILAEDLEKLKKHYKWRLCPNPYKRDTCASHLNNLLAHKKLNVTFCAEWIKHNKQVKYMSQTLVQVSHLQKTSRTDNPET